MLFLDESAFTVGPNSDVVLDEFVFDPDTGTGRIALTAAKGVFRLVGGKISKRTPVTLKTPTAVIGIRGGIALVNVAPNGATQATFLFGDQMTVGTAGGTQAVSRPGFTVSADDPDAPPSNPTPATPAQLNAALGGLEGSAPPPPDGGEGGGGEVAAARRRRRRRRRRSRRRRSSANGSECRRLRDRRIGIEQQPRCPRGQPATAPTDTNRRRRTG